MMLGIKTHGTLHDDQMRVASLSRDGLEELYQAGARKFVVWDLCAGEAVPLANTLNNLMNTVNAILQGLRALDAHQNALRDFTRTFVVGWL
jgi:hypothetical protein